MQLTETTVNQLKVFSNIYPGILFRPGNVISTCTKAKNFFARATVDVTFDREFGIYDLRRFLAVISLFENPELVFEPKFVKITDGKRTVKYFYAEKSTFEYPPETPPQLPDPVGKFKLPSQVLKNLFRATGILKLPHLKLVGAGSKVELHGLNTAQSTDNTFVEELDSSNVIMDGDYTLLFAMDLFKLLPIDYTVTVTERALKFETGDAEYLIAVQG